MFGSTSSSPRPSAKTSASAQPSASASAQPTASGSSTPTPSPTPVTLPQERVWTAQQVYDYNPNFSVAPKHTPSTYAQPLVELDGESFGWTNDTSGDQIEIAVARPASETLQQYSGQVAQDYQVVPIDNAPAGTVGYFAAKDGVGVLQVFTPNGYWFVVDSKTFLEPGDAYQIADDVIGNLQ
jgi:hypothetical protein